MTEETSKTYDMPEVKQAGSDMSTDIGELVGALATAQGEMTGAKKDSQNPFFKSNYADLAAVWDACREPLSKSGIAVIQTTEPDEGGVMIVTLLAHKSGQWIRGRLRVRPNKNDAQAIGSAITYGRRYSLAAAVGLAQVDDDGEAAMNRGPVTGQSVDMGKITKAVTFIRQVIDEEDEATIGDVLTRTNEKFSNDELLELQKALKGSSPEGTRKTYWSVYQEWIRLHKEAAA